MRTFLLSFLLASGLGAAAAPTISHVTPDSAFYFGGTRVTIHGSGFGTSRQAVQVYFGDDPMPTTPDSVQPTQITATLFPPNGREAAIGTSVGVRVVTPEGSVTAQDRILFDKVSDGTDNYTQYLVPLTTETIDGANGSRWKAELTLFNASDYPAGIIGPFNDPRFLTPPPQPYHEVAPHRTDSPTLFSSGATAGAFIHVPNPLAFSVKKSQRVRDLSQNATSWGTELPIVPVRKFAPDVWLTDIPTDAKYRATLRVYHLSHESGLPAEVTVHAANRTAPVTTYVLRSTGTMHGIFTDLPTYPAYSQIDLLTPQVRAAGATVHVAIHNLGANVSPPLPHLWALVSITNNETQQVTIVTPNK